MINNLKQKLFIGLFLLSGLPARGQVGIGTTTPDTTAAMDVSSTTKGFLIPRMGTAQRTAILSPANGLMVFDSTLNQFYYYTGISWNALPAAANVWSTAGNSGTSSASSFIGTTDAQALQIKVNAAKAGFIDYLSAPGNTSLGYQSLNASTGSTTIGIGNTAFGYQTAMNMTTSSENTAIGYQALKTQAFTNSGSNLATDNTAVGYKALAANNPTNSGSGIRNTAVGANALAGNSAGYTNTAIGASTLQNNSGNSNTALGSQSLQNNTGMNDNTAIGYLAMNLQSYGGSFSAANTAVGYKALYANQPTSSSTGYHNTAVGYAALLTNTTGAGNTAIGYGADVTTNNLTNATAIGAGAVVSASNSLVLGNSANVGIGTSSPTKKLEVSGTTKTDSLQAVNLRMTNGAVDGFIMKTDGNGNASWINPSNFAGSSTTWTANGNDQYAASTGNVGIGISTPTKKLEVIGTIKADSFQLTTNASAGSLLQSDGSGNAYWTSLSALGTWSFNGNSGTSSSSNFLGTTDAQALQFRVNNTKAGFIDYLSAPGNTSLGYQALNAITGSATTGISNTAIGYQAAAGMTSTSQNVAIGYQALKSQSFSNSGSNLSTDNVAIGYKALTANQPSGTNDGNKNVAIGTQALVANTTGASNFAVGYNSLLSNTTGNHNIGEGVLALSSNTTGSFNAAIGTQAAQGNISASHNISIGYQSLQQNAYSSANIAIGTQALNHISYTNGNATYNSDNIAIGYNALTFDQPTNSGNGARNVAIGNLSMFQNTTGYQNVSIGYNTLNAQTTGQGSVAVGYNALAANNSSLLTAVGYNALAANTSGIQNTAIGGTSLAANVQGGANTAVGYQCMPVNTYAGNNTAMGVNALNAQSYSNANSGWASDNTAIGYKALLLNQPTSTTTGYRNTALGSGALQTNITGSTNTAVGYGADVTVNNLTNATAIGAGAVVSTSNSLVLGNNANVGIGISSPTAKLDINGTVRIGGNGTALNSVIKLTASTASLTVNPGTTAAYSYIVPNAATGSTVMVSPGAVLDAGLIIAYARVSAANTVEISYANISAATVNLTAGIDLYITIVQ